MRVFLATLAVMAAPGVGWADASKGLELPTRDAAEGAIWAASPRTAEPLGVRFASVADRLEAGRTEVLATAPAEHGVPSVLGAERAQILLRSLTIPGWGQATMGGHETSAKVFLLTEAGIWTSFAAFRVQEGMRQDTYLKTAQLFAGIDLDGKDEEFRRIVGVYPSSDDYNLYVVRRDAANLYYDNPALYDQYIAEHELKGGDTWKWSGQASFDQYIEERKATRKAALRANAMLGLAIANRLVSALFAARQAGAPTSAPRSWNLECGPHPEDPKTLALGMRLRF